MTIGDSPYLDDRNRVASYLRKNPATPSAERALSSEVMYCTVCLAFQHQAVTIPFVGGYLAHVEESEYGPFPPVPTRSPYLLRYVCRGCASEHWGLLAIADEPPPDREENPIERSRLALIRVSRRPTTGAVDRSVRYFFHEGETARLAGAYAAALAMYRAAAEALVRSAGVSGGTLDQGLRQLEQRLAAGTPVPALAGLPVEVLHGLRAIGNAAVHFTRTGGHERSNLRAQAALAASTIVALLVNPKRGPDWQEQDAAYDIAEAVKNLNAAAK